jgi:hypothetical protein
MKAFGIPRFDSGAAGIHLLWTWPDVLPLSTHGYDIQRLEYSQKDWRWTCETISRQMFDLLRILAEIPAPLGPLRLQTGVTFTRAWDDSLGTPTVGFWGPTVYSAGAYKSPSFSVLIQELTRPADRISVEIENDEALLVIALSGGKSVAVAVGDGSGYILLSAPSIDVVRVYFPSNRLLFEAKICVASVDATAAEWAKAPYLVRGLTLPIHEADPALTTPATEYAAAKRRLLGTETLSQADFEQFVATLRKPVAATALGRSGQRVVLARGDPTQTYEELTLNHQLAALAIHPKLRRVLGFGFADRKGLTKGSTYVYRVTGHFDAGDVADTIYDFHLVPSATVLPAAFTLGALGLRFALPVTVVLDPSPSTTALQDTSRRGVSIQANPADASWLLPSLDTWSVVLDFPTPVSQVVLEVDTNHSFRYVGGIPWEWPLGAVLEPVPAAPRAELNFPQPISQLRLTGAGTLYGIRIPSGAKGTVDVYAVTPPISYTAQPLPIPPLPFFVENLQEPLATLTGPIDESTPVQPRPPVGMRLNWLPATVGGVPIWPTDVDAGPPLDSIAYVIDHRTVIPPSTYGSWDPLQGGDNLTLGSRDDAAPDVPLLYGCDLAVVFPEARPRSADSGLALHLSDIFGQADPATGEQRPEQPLGSYHQYQIRSMDAVGRVGTLATLSNIVRLETHIPPPLPVGPQPEPPLDSNGRLTAPLGPRARAILRGAPGLTAADIALLGSHSNAILLEWGWRPQERDIDPATTEFRVYLTAPLDTVHASVTAVSSASPNWLLGVTTDLPLVANELAGQWITCNGYPFQVVANTAGTSPTITVGPPALSPTIPVIGPLVFGRPLAPQHQRASGWDQRVAVYPLTAADTYQHVFYDLFSLSPAQPRGSVWVGVSAADDQPYVPDERTAGPNANRPGNESAIVTCTVDARYRGQPVFSVPPPLGDVPEIVTDEPTGRQVLASLDLAALLGGALPAGAPIAIERCSSDDVTSALSVVASAVTLTHADGTRETITFANPGDEAAVLATLSSNTPQALANRYLLHVVAASSDPMAFFTRLSSDIDQVGSFEDRLPPKPSRFLYCVRAADALGHLSDGGAILPVVVRVPSIAPAVTVRFKALSTTNTSISLSVIAPSDPGTTYALLFADLAPAGTDPPTQGEAQLLRIPNRRDLYPNNGIRLLLSDGTLLSPALSKPLGDPDVTIAADGTRTVMLTIPATRGQWATLWCFAMTSDGIPSQACGPFSTGVGS